MHFTAVDSEFWSQERKSGVYHTSAEEIKGVIIHYQVKLGSYRRVLSGHLTFLYFARRRRPKHLVGRHVSALKNWRQTRSRQTDSGGPNVCICLYLDHSLFSGTKNKNQFITKQTKCEKSDVCVYVFFGTDYRSRLCVFEPSRGAFFLKKKGLAR